ncbi:TetR/AcrR family transcriptional regulator [Kordiimonas gwangyangensis]|uniref:TetR/AcrR family transcriptional regulator n=1 Tax=Kordiimonas gwangyangensis TaxID=288022 RepID=UPI000365C40E|nr:TetR/AcrR family transcriptional regulator [Kordiimonas gwangyangensis]
MTPTRGRPRSFDPEKAIEAAQAVFWKHGYEATSLNQLAEAVGLHKPSLYAAFGDKKALYLKALQAYIDAAQELLKKALAEPKLRDALAAFYRTDIEIFMADRGRGCFLLSTAVPVAGLIEEAGEMVAATRKSVAGALTRRLAMAQEAGELAPDRDLFPLVSLLASTHIALALRARSGEDEDALWATAEAAIDMVCGG